MEGPDRSKGQSILQVLATTRTDRMTNRAGREEGKNLGHGEKKGYIVQRTQMDHESESALALAYLCSHRSPLPFLSSPSHACNSVYKMNPPRQT